MPRRIFASCHLPERPETAERPRMTITAGGLRGRDLPPAWPRTCKSIIRLVGGRARIEGPSGRQHCSLGRFAMSLIAEALKANRKYAEKYESLFVVHRPRDSWFRNFYSADLPSVSLSAHNRFRLVGAWRPSASAAASLACVAAWREDFPPGSGLPGCATLVMQGDDAEPSRQSLQGLALRASASSSIWRVPGYRHN